MAGNSVSPTTTLTAQTANNTSEANSFRNQTNGNASAGNVSKVDVHSLLYSGAVTKVYAHLLLWFGGSNHMNVGYSSNDAAQVHRQIMDMISRGIQGVIIDWYGPNNNIDQATKLVMAEAEAHPGFTFAIMIDQGAIKWDSCSGCSPQEALIQQLQYIEQTYFPSSAYMKWEGKPVVTNFNIDLSYTVSWDAVTEALSSQPVFLFQNNSGFSHALSSGSYSWVMPTAADYGLNYLTSFYYTGMPLENEQTVGASYKGFNDTLASWGSNRIMGQQCGQTWLQTFSEINDLYNSGKQLAALQLVTWNDYEEGTEIESGVNNCLSVTASSSGSSLRWNVNGNETTVDHYVAYVSTDGQNLMSLGEAYLGGTRSVNLCSYSLHNGSYVSYVQAVGKPSIANQMSGAVKVTLNCTQDNTTNGSLTLGANPSALTISAGTSGKMTVSVTPLSGSFNNSIALECSGLPANLGCSFSPASITPGASVATSVLTFKSGTVTSAHGGERRTFFFASGLFSFGLLGITVIGKISRRRMIGVIGFFVLICLVLFASSCGGGGSSAITSSSAGSYVVTIKGNAGSTQLSTTVLVTVK